jgi:hypothetical protein
MSETPRVVIGMDPHKRSVTIEVMTSDGVVVGKGRFGTDRDGHEAMLRHVKAWPDRVWAIEGCQGIGRHVANRLLAAGESVVDVPPKLSARARVFATGQGRKTDATDAHSVAPASAGGAGGGVDWALVAAFRKRASDQLSAALGQERAFLSVAKRREQGRVIIEELVRLEAAEQVTAGRQT